MNDWKPGGIAIATVRGVPDMRVHRSFDNTHWVSIEPVKNHYDHPDEWVTDARRLIVLDPEHEVVKAFRGTYAPVPRGPYPPQRLAALIEEQLTPAKPPMAEPTEIGAVVVSGSANRPRFTRWADDPAILHHWISEHSDVRTWSQIENPEPWTPDE